MHATDSADFDAAASRLYETVVASRREEAGFAEVLSDGLAVALRLLDTDRQLAHDLLGGSVPWSGGFELCVRWQQRFAELLQGAALEAGCQETPFNLELHLIGGATSLIAEAQRHPPIPLNELHASLLEIFLTYYLEPEELRAALANFSPLS